MVRIEMDYNMNKLKNARLECRNHANNGLILILGYLYMA